MSSMNHPVNKSTLEAECRALWRAVYAARVVSGMGRAERDADFAVGHYRERYKPRQAKEVS